MQRASRGGALGADRLAREHSEARAAAIAALRAARSRTSSHADDDDCYLMKLNNVRINAYNNELVPLSYSMKFVSSYIDSRRMWLLAMYLSTPCNEVACSKLNYTFF